MQELADLLTCPLELAERIVRTIGGAHRFRCLAARDLVRSAPISPCQADLIVSALRFAAAGWRAAPTVPVLASPNDVARSMAYLTAESSEQLWLVTVTSGLQLIDRHKIAEGGRTRCVVELPDVLRPVIADGAAGFFLVHNHPSGDPTPSEMDVRLTDQLSRAAGVLGLVLHDHLVIGSSWASILSGACGSLDSELTPVAVNDPR